ncbi:MAG: hypothetical protein J3K34DRAFT_138887 [Monoraphidium minutum]|nr:MAG: hypothetical protein J3K34DRAFT_138887 [Monoraphidium minutum]
MTAARWTLTSSRARRSRRRSGTRSRASRGSTPSSTSLHACCSRTSAPCSPRRACSSRCQTRPATASRCQAASAACWRRAAAAAARAARRRRRRARGTQTSCERWRRALLLHWRCSCSHHPAGLHCIGHCASRVAHTAEFRSNEPRVVEPLAEGWGITLRLPSCLCQGGCPALCCLALL